MFRIGITEMLVIALAIFVLFGPEALPDIARTIGKFLRELEKGFRDNDPAK